MTNLSATVRLRPTRIALLVRPTDLTSIRRFMRACACLWGGVFNPIIPVFRTPPTEWRPSQQDRVRGYAVARGYVGFYEPDVFVEAEDGLLEDAGLGDLRGKQMWRRRVVPLKNLFERPEHREWADLSVGLGMMDAFERIYQEERRFQLREPREAVLVRPQQGTALVEAMFGIYPTEKPTLYIGQGYKDVYQPEALSVGPDAWRKVFLRGAQTPLRATRYGIEVGRTWRHDLVVFVFDPGRPTDLIDLWNIRLEQSPVLPVPLPWFAELADDIGKLLSEEHRPVQGNRFGAMHQGTVEFARSIDPATKDAALAHLKSMSVASLLVSSSRTRIWVRQSDDRIHRDERLEITAKEQRLSLEVDESATATIKFENLAPDFAVPYGGRDMRWVNAVKLSGFGATSVATVVPFNTFDWNWPRLDYMGEQVGVGTEGWTYGQRFKASTQTIHLHAPEKIIIGALERSGIEAKLSEPGHIARQVLNHLGGLWGIALLADRETLRLLNAMAGGLRRREAGGIEAEEEFDRRSKPIKDWVDLLKRRNAGQERVPVSLEEFTSRNILRVGIETTCLHCQALNWHSLSSTDYELACERCLQNYAFPQANIRAHSRNWAYRVAGPFSVPDYARGAYGALLALQALGHVSGAYHPMTFSTALGMRFGGVEAEADFVAFWERDSMERKCPPELVVGEAKSFGEGDLIKKKDLEKLKAIGARLPGACIAIAVMRDGFTQNEKALLLQFVRWARRPNSSGGPSNPVILLTGIELFHNFGISSTWEKLGGRYADYAHHQYVQSLKNFAEATQAIHLDLPSHYEQRHRASAKRRARKQGDAPASQG